MAFFWQNPSTTLRGNPLNRAKRFWTADTKEQARRWMKQHLMEFVDPETGSVDERWMATMAAYELDAPEWARDPNHEIYRLAYDVWFEDQRVWRFRDRVGEARKIIKESGMRRTGQLHARTAGDVYGRGRLP